MKRALFCLLIGFTGLANAHAADASTSAVYPFPGTDNLPSEGDTSVVIRQADAVRIRVRTSGLDPVSPYTLWAVVFNNPQHCASSPCSDADLPIVPGHDPRVEASIVHAGGGISDANGRGDFVGRVFSTRGDVTAAERLFGPGLIEPKRAEIHVVVRGHGYPAAEDYFAAIASFAGGCTTDNQVPCEDQQFAVHLAN